MPMDLSTTSAISEEFKQYYDRTLLEAARPELLHNQFGQSRPIPARYATSIEFRKYALLAAATVALTEGTPPSGSNADVTNVTASISQYGDFVRGSDVVETQAFDDHMNELAGVQGQQMGNTLDILTRNILVAGTTVQFGDAKGSRGQIGSTNYLDAVEIAKVVRTLSRLDAPKWPGALYRAIIHPDTKYDLQQDSTLQNFWRDAGQRGVEADNPLFSANLGRIFGVEFFETSNARVFLSLGLSGADIYATLVFGRNAYGVVELEELSAETIYHPKGSAGTADPLNQTWTNGWKASHTAVILDQNFLVRIEHTSAYKNAA